MDAREAFAELVGRDAAEIELDRAALLFAAVAQPGLDVEAHLGRLDRMAAELRPRISPEDSPGRVVVAIDEYLFGELGFRGNELDYYDPRNSYLNEVLDRRLGIPISLSVVYMELARRVGFRLEGVGMPGHFLLRHPDPRDPLLVDAFNRGAIVTVEQCRERLRGIYGDALPMTSETLRTADSRAILRRMLLNLKNAYVQRDEIARAIEAVELILVVEPAAVGELRDRGLLRFRVGDFRGARADLERYLEVGAEPGEQSHVRQQIALMDRLDAMRN